MDSQQLAAKVTGLENRVATLEDEGKIVRGEVKQILTEIRSAVLARDNPFEGDSSPGHAQPAAISVAPAAPAVKLEIESPPPAPQPQAAAPDHTYYDAPGAREPVMLHPRAEEHEPEPRRPHWSLLTIASLSAWAEEAMRRLGTLRLEILLDLCEAAGHISPEARQALSRVTELDVPEPAQAPSTNETVVVLRQLDALIADEEGGTTSRLQHAA